MLSKLHQTLHHYSLYKMAALRFVCSVMTLLLITLSMSQAVLDTHYYDQTCPQAEVIVSQTVRNASIYDPKVPARILRMFFHDCFIRGCDASILLDSTPENQAEKDGPPDISVRSFYVIDDAKVKLEKACPGTVSCADIIAIAARDVVAMEGQAGMYKKVEKTEESQNQATQSTYQVQHST
ncbi:Peroxidase 66 [Linum perenne]